MCRGPAWPELATAAAPGDRSRRRAARSISRSSRPDGSGALPAGREQLPGLVDLDELEPGRHTSTAFAGVVGVELELVTDLGKRGPHVVALEGLGTYELAVLDSSAGDDPGGRAVEPQREHRDRTRIGHRHGRAARFERAGVGEVVKIGLDP